MEAGLKEIWSESLQFKIYLESPYDGSKFLNGSKFLFELQIPQPENWKAYSLMRLVISIGSWLKASVLSMQSLHKVYF